MRLDRYEARQMRAGQPVDTSTPLRLLSRFTWSAHVSSSGGVAQLVEQRTHKPRVTRSIRVTATIQHMSPTSLDRALYPNPFPYAQG